MSEETWFCEECHVKMEQFKDYAKCPECGAEVWLDGEGSYERETQAADIAEQIHGKWFCQRCQRQMETITGDFAKCPECGAEVWFGMTKQETKRVTKDEITELMKDFTKTHESEPYAAMIGGRAAHGGGGSRTRKAKDKRAAMKKPTCEELYRRLCNS